jgi:hypothetical protein
MIEGMEAVLHSVDEVNVLVEVEARIARSWGGHVVPPEIGHRAVRWFVA